MIPVMTQENIKSTKNEPVTGGLRYNMVSGAHGRQPWYNRTMDRKYLCGLVVEEGCNDMPFFARPFPHVFSLFENIGLMTT